MNAIGRGGRSFLEIKKCLGVASSAISSLTAVFGGVDNRAEENRSGFIWALVLPILLYGSEAWSLGARKRGPLNDLVGRAL